MMADDITIDEYLIKGDRKYMKSHEWVLDLGDGMYQIGISDYAQKMLREITYVQFDDEDTEFEQKEVILTVEAIKASGDIYAPFKLLLVENNEVLEDEPEKINEDPYGEGWLAKFKAVGFDDSLLITPEEYKAVIEQELGDL